MIIIKSASLLDIYGPNYMNYRATDHAQPYDASVFAAWQHQLNINLNFLLYF